MTTRQAIKVIQTLLMDYLRGTPIENENDEAHVRYVDEAWKIIRRLALEAENRPSDGLNAVSWGNVSEVADKTETERLAQRTINMVEELWEKIAKLEKTVTYHDVLINGIMERVEK